MTPSCLKQWDVLTQSSEKPSMTTKTPMWNEFKRQERDLDAMLNEL